MWKTLYYTYYVSLYLFSHTYEFVSSLFLLFPRNFKICAEKIQCFQNLGQRRSDWVLQILIPIKKVRDLNIR